MEKNQEPELQTSLEPERQKNTESSPQMTSAVVSLMAVGLLAVLGTAFFSGQKTTDTPSVSAISTSEKGDNVSNDARAQIDGQFMRYTGKLQLLDITDKKSKEEFLVSPYMNEAEKEKALAAVTSGEKKIGIVSLWDNQDEDGDVVRIQTSEASVDVSIFHAPMRVFIPFKPGEPLLIIGVHDGGGGITAAIETQSGAVPLPIMTIGQTIVLPLL